MGLVLVNEGPDPDRLLDVTSPIADETQLFADPKPQETTDSPTAVPDVSVPAGAAGTSVPVIVELRHLTTSAREGQSYPVTFRFLRAGSVQTTVPVVIHKGP